MNDKIRKLFEEHTVPNFGAESATTRNKNGEYIIPAIEDHWQTFQEAAELILTEVTDILATYRMKAIFVDGIEYNCQHPIYAIRKHFGVES